MKRFWENWNNYFSLGIQFWLKRQRRIFNLRRFCISYFQVHFFFSNFRVEYKPFEGSNYIEFPNPFILRCRFSQNYFYTFDFSKLALDIMKWIVENKINGRPKVSKLTQENFLSDLSPFIVYPCHWVLHRCIAVKLINEGLAHWRNSQMFQAFFPVRKNV